jgi:hypothetical protein
MRADTQGQPGERTSAVASRAENTEMRNAHESTPRNSLVKEPAVEGAENREN